MKDPKFIFKVNHNGSAEVYCDGEWHKLVAEIKIDAKPQDISVNITKYKVNEKGMLYTVNNEIPTEVKNFHFGNKVSDDGSKSNV